MKAGTAVLIARTDDETPEIISCDDTIAANQCPWQDAMRGRGTPVTSGMFGTPCWYRGKVGTWMLGELNAAGHVPPGSFYGEGEDGVLDPEYCITLGQWMEDHGEEYARLVASDEAMVPKIEQYRYAAWWLKWVAASSDGCHAWY